VAMDLLIEDKQGPGKTFSTATSTLFTDGRTTKNVEELKKHNNVHEQP